MGRIKTIKAANVITGGPSTMHEYAYNLPVSACKVGLRLHEIRGSVCPAPDQGSECGECRACWDPEVKNVAHWLH